MNALIRTNTGFYCSTIFAYLDKGRKSSAITFDENGLRLIIVQCHNSSRRDVLFADESQDGWIENGKWRGLDFIVNDKTLLRRIKKGLDAPTDILNKCKALQTTETFDGWKKLNTANDIEKLMNISLAFHDGYIEDIEQDGNNLYVTFVCWSCRITIQFVDLIDFNPGKGISWNNNCILEAKMGLEENSIKWFVYGFCFVECDDQDCYFTSKHAQYKVELCNSL